jgi:2-C-methyl-D-erythritol 4-phosphate cytidylyltransferase
VDLVRSLIGRLRRYARSVVGDVIWTIVVAGGSGSRFGSRKQFEVFGGSTVIGESISVARHVSEGVVAVVPEGSLDRDDGADAAVAGGSTRAASVRAGLAAVPERASIILVHDAARPLATVMLYERVIGAVRLGADAVVPVISVTDTLRTLDGAAVDRDELVAVQTPQGFTASALRAAHRNEPEATDDASLVSAAGGTVVTVEGDRWNLKLTEPSDVVVAVALRNARMGQ